MPAFSLHPFGRLSADGDDPGSEEIGYSERAFLPCGMLPKGVSHKTDNGFNGKRH